jgi:phage internal scaffolding protein
MKYAQSLKDRAKRETRKTFTEESRTSQSAADAVDVHKIMKNYNATGLLRRVHEGQLEYKNLAAVVNEDGRFELGEAYQLIAQARENFDELPAYLRAKFDNNPQVFHEFVNNPANYEAMVELGLAIADPAPNIEGVVRDRASGQLRAKRKEKPDEKAETHEPEVQPESVQADGTASPEKQPQA